MAAGAGAIDLFRRLRRDERPRARADHGVVRDFAIDLGAGATGIAVFADDALVHCETIAAGGVRLTRDLAAKLETTFAAAERVKLHFGAVGNDHVKELTTRIRQRSKR